MNNKILILMGGMCSGKSAIIKDLVKNHKFEEIKYYSTRPKRNENDKDYLYVTDDEFYRMVESNLFVSWQKYFVNTENGKMLWKYGQQKTIKVGTKKQVIQLPYSATVDLANYLDKGAVVMFLDCKEDVRRRRALKRGDLEIEVDRRLLSEKNWLRQAEECSDIMIPTDRALKNIIDDIVSNYEYMN